MTAQYYISLIGAVSSSWSKLEPVLYERLKDLGIDRDAIAVLVEADIGTANPRAPLVAIFFGYDGANDASHPCLARLITDSNTIIPCVPDLGSASTALPTSIGHINAFPFSDDEKHIERLATLVLENLRLLRAERRLFISYKRSESQSVAIQLYEALDEAGFDVFLDTRSVPYAEDFQSILWHRMADSDIIILLDTPKFRESFWTRAELAQANATSVQILHVLWPKVNADDTSSFSVFMPLKPSDFVGPDDTGVNARLSDKMRDSIVSRAESLRARALAARHRSLVDDFCDRAREENAISVAVQPQRFIAVELAKGGRVAVVPTIGVPRADRYQEIGDGIRELGDNTSSVWLLYDERGILGKWLSHLAWLDNHLPVRSVQVSRSAEQLRRSVP